MIEKKINIQEITLVTTFAVSVLLRIFVSEIQTHIETDFSYSLFSVFFSSSLVVFFFFSSPSYKIP